MKKLKIDNIIYNVIEMNTFFKKLKGLMFKKEINDLYLFKTNGIHSLFMFKTIDVLLLDKNYKVLYKYTLKPWRVLLPKKKVFFTIEMPMGENKYFTLGETLTFEKK